MTFPKTLNRDEVAAWIHALWAERGEPESEDYTVADAVIEFIDSRTLPQETPEYVKHMEDTITKFGPLSSRDSDGDAEYQTWLAEMDEGGSSHEEWMARLVTAESYAEDKRDGAR